MPKRKTDNEFKKEMSNINPNIIILENFTKVRNRILVKCKICDNEWSPEARSLLMGNGCPKCKIESRRKTTNQFKKELQEINPNIEVIGEYKGANDYILVKDKICGHTWNTTTASSLLNGTTCPICSSTKKTTEQFKQEMLLINPNIEILGEYINNVTKILVKDKTCGHEWMSANPSNLLLGQGCPECAKYKRWNNRERVDRLGEINYNKHGTKMTIIRFNTVKDIDIEFDNGYIAYNKQYNPFKKGEIVSPYDRTIYNIGYLGEGTYTPTINNKNTPQYFTWSAMIKRCYDKKQQKKQPSYIGCSVCEEWHNFQNYAKWWDENYYKIENQRMEVDKDILHKGNKIYAPNNCVFVPNRINTLFIKNDSIRGELPIGVKKTGSGKYRADYSNTILGKRIHIGCFDSPIKAFNAYKFHKEYHIKEVADYFKNQIPSELYEAMCNWIVEIDD